MDAIMRGVSRLKQPIVRETLSYLFWGVMTTAVNVAVFFLVRRAAGAAAVQANVAAWVAAVAFAFVTNRRFVFGSSAAPGLPVAREFFLFAASRLFSGLVDTALIFVTVDVIGLSDLPMKVLANVLVIVLNYATGKWLVFRKESGGISINEREAE